LPIANGKKAAHGKSANRGKQFHLVPSGSIGRFVCSAEPAVLSALHHAFGVRVMR
jgi:hypothetical protein